MFTDGYGSPIHPHALYQSFRRIIAKPNIPPLRFHDLRHTHGSLLIKGGVPVKVVSERLGHAHIAHTMQTYCTCCPAWGLTRPAPSSASMSPVARLD